MLRALACILILLAGAASAQSQPDLYRYHADQHTRWSSPENRLGTPGRGGIENKGGKGHAWDNIEPGQAYVMADLKGSGTIDRMWLTIDDRSPEVLRALKLDIYWDGATTPAVSVPLGDFFLHGAGAMVPMETALFASPEGRSFVSYVPMPFRKAGRVVLTNEGAKRVNIFYDVDSHSVARQPDDALYFHAWWHRERATVPGRDFDILPRIQGHGRFLGSSISVLTNPAYEQSWWGEGEAKIRLDGDREHASLVGTGTEDFIGSAWGQGAYVNRFQGSPIATWDNGGLWSFYRFHISDPVWFHSDIQVSIAQLGGAPRPDVVRFQKNGAPLIPVSVDDGDRAKGFFSLLATGQKVTDPKLPDAWTIYYRSDDVAAVAYFYFDRPDRVLPAIAPVAERVAALRKPAEKK
jgi:hypothetical protein